MLSWRSPLHVPLKERMPNDDSERFILARRARFVAAAVATLAVGCGKDRASTASTVDATALAVDAGVDGSTRHLVCLCYCQPGDPLCSCL
jgi:hypothetical protein